MRFPANCLIVALVFGGLRMRGQRVADNTVHFYWRDRHGLAWNFTAPNREGRGYLGNALYLGSIQRRRSCDRG